MCCTNKINYNATFLHKIFYVLLYIIKQYKKYGFDPSLTENEMVEKLGYIKIWNCGLIKYVWKNKNVFNEI